MPQFSSDDYSMFVVEGAEINNDTVLELRTGLMEIPSDVNSNLHISQEILSKHSLMLGSIGSGKSNLMFHFVKKIRSMMTDDDCIIFLILKVII